MPLSYSQLATYRRCPKQYEYAYIKKVARPISRGESFGSSIHNTLKRWGELELAHTAAKQPASQLTIFVEHAQPHIAPLDIHTLLTLWRGCFIAEGYETRAEMDAHLMRGEQALKHFFDWWSQEQREVVAIEKSFKLEVPPPTYSGKIPVDTVLSGRLDRVERCGDGVRVIDFKSSQPRNQQDVDADLQLSIYAHAARKLWDVEACELILLFVSEDECLSMSTTRNASQLKDAQTAIGLVAGRIAEGDFRATPSVEKCRHCPYRDVCPARAV